MYIIKWEPVWDSHIVFVPIYELQDPKEYPIFEMIVVYD